jgi:DNA mismatch endonuclease, patch repair protein
MHSLPNSLDGMRDRLFVPFKQPMADVFTRKKRSYIMSRIKSQDTKPEILVRRLVHSLGYRFRLRLRSLPGKPDIVLARHKKVIFVHGCFWHGHSRCKRATLPSTNRLFWQNKIARNKARDKIAKKMLRHQGWEVLEVWQCQTTNNFELEQRLGQFLS